MEPRYNYAVGLRSVRPPNIRGRAAPRTRSVLWGAKDVPFPGGDDGSRRDSEGATKASLPQDIASASPV